MDLPDPPAPAETTLGPQRLHRKKKKQVTNKSLGSREQAKRNNDATEAVEQQLGGRFNHRKVVQLQSSVGKPTLWSLLHESCFEQKHKEYPELPPGYENRELREDYVGEWRLSKWQWSHMMTVPAPGVIIHTTKDELNVPLLWIDLGDVHNRRMVDKCIIGKEGRADELFFDVGIQIMFQDHYKPQFFRDVIKTWDFKLKIFDRAGNMGNGWTPEKLMSYMRPDEIENFKTMQEIEKKAEETVKRKKEKKEDGTDRVVEGNIMMEIAHRNYTAYKKFLHSPDDDQLGSPEWRALARRNPLVWCCNIINTVKRSRSSFFQSMDSFSYLFVSGQNNQYYGHDCFKDERCWVTWFEDHQEIPFNHLQFLLPEDAPMLPQIEMDNE